MVTTSEPDPVPRISSDRLASMLLDAYRLDVPRLAQLLGDPEFGRRLAAEDRARVAVLCSWLTGLGHLWDAGPPGSPLREASEGALAAASRQLGTARRLILGVGCALALSAAAMAGFGAWTWSQARTAQRIANIEQRIDELSDVASRLILRSPTSPPK